MLKNVAINKFQVDSARAAAIERKILDACVGQRTIEIEVALAMAYADVAEGMRGGSPASHADRMVCFVERALLKLAEEVRAVQAMSDAEVHAFIQRTHGTNVDGVN